MGGRRRRKRGGERGERGERRVRKMIVTITQDTDIARVLAESLAQTVPAAGLPSSSFVVSPFLIVIRRQR